MTSKKRNFTPTLLGAVLILLAFAVLYQRQAGKKGFPEPLSATEFKLNTVVTITLYDSDDPSILEGAFALCDKYEAMFSRTLEGSELYQLNHGTLPEEAGSFLLSAETAELIEKGLSYGRLLKGPLTLPLNRSLPSGILLQAQRKSPHRKQSLPLFLWSIIRMFILKAPGFPFPVKEWDWIWEPSPKAISQTRSKSSSLIKEWRAPSLIWEEMCSV